MISGQTGSDAWAGASGNKAEACQIPSNWPKRCRPRPWCKPASPNPLGAGVFDSDTSLNSVFKNQFFNQFNGLENWRPKGRGACVLDYYRKFAGSIKKGKGTRYWMCPCAGCSFPPRDLGAIYLDQKEQLASLCFSVAIHFAKAPEQATLPLNRQLWIEISRGSSCRHSP